MDKSITIPDFVASVLGQLPIYVSWEHSERGTLVCKSNAMNSGSVCIDPSSRGALVKLVDLLPDDLLVFLHQAGSSAMAANGICKAATPSKSLPKVDKKSRSFIAGLTRDKGLSLVKGEKAA